MEENMDYTHVNPEKLDRINALMNMCEPVVEYLQNNFHPHTTVIIEADGIRVEENLATRPIAYAVD